MRGSNEVNEENEHVKHLYLRQLVERGGRDPKTGCVSRVVENLRRRPPSGLICA